ncbi:MAG: Gfo/Idh/MocA family oxidoreductase [Lachnospiraceae bacterium]|jgi:predicted dehydrogenase|nr:Gfo/Idh/MocA family oxidoreductase [Lachnospiraceae bacterium]
MKDTNKEHRIIVVGCGAMSNHWIQMATRRDDCAIVALVDPDLANAKRRKDDYSLTAVTYSNLSEALAAEEANLVFDVTPPQYHQETVMTALKAGCDVFGEKPMSDTLAEAERMVECSEATGREYFVMQNRRYVPGLWTLREFLVDKRLGTVGQISADFQLGPRFRGFRTEMDSPLIADMAIHTFDAARFLTGQNAVSVYCHEFNPSWSWYKGAANAVCIFEMEDGSVFDYRGSWCANGMVTSWEAQWRVSCSEGVVFWDGGERLDYEQIVPEGCRGSKSGTGTIELKRENVTLLPMPLTGHDACVSEMFAALQSGKRPQTDCRDNIHSIRMVYKAIESAKTGKRLML